MEQAKKTPKNRQNRANLLIMVSSRFQRLIQVEWPAKTQETEFGVIRSRGKRRTASSMSRPKKRQKCSREQNWGNLLILVFFRFQHPILVEWPAKAQETEFGAIRSRGKRKAASSWSQQKNRQKTAKTCQSANNGVFPFPTLDSGGMACKSPRNRVWCNSVNGYAQDSVVLEPAEKPTKNRQKRATLLIMVSSRFQRSIQVEWPAKAQETEFGAIWSRGKRKAASSWSQQKKRQKTAKTCQSANNGVFPFPTLDSGGMACKSPRNRVWCNSVNGYAQDSVVLEPAEKPTKNRQNRANLLIMVSSRFQRSIQVEWRAKAQEIKFGAIRSRGKRRAASSWSRPKKTPKVAPGSKIGVIC